MKKLSYFEQSEEIYTPFERLEMENENLKEEIQILNHKLRSETNLLIKRIDDLETYIHGPTRKPFDE